MPQLNQGRSRADKAARQKNRPVKNTAQVRDTTNTGLAEISLKIKALEKKSIANVVEIGRLLSLAAEQCEHGEYMDWLKREFGWSHDTSLNYRKVYNLSQNPKISDFDKLDISISALYLVAKLDPDNDDAIGAQAIIEAAKQGRVSYKMAVAIVKAAYVAEDDRHLAEQERIHQLFIDYAERFGGVYGEHLDDNICRLMEAALRSGVDEPELVQKKRENEEYRAEYNRKHAEFLVTPITAETEQEYTGRIKNRKLYEGACELAWEQYFIFRDQHPECEPLTENDLKYLALWTPCRTKRPQDQEAIPPDEAEEKAKRIAASYEAAREAGAEASQKPSRDDVEAKARAVAACLPPEDKDREVSIFRITAHEAVLLAQRKYDGPVTEEVIRSAQKAEDAWKKVRMALEQRRTP